MYLTVILRTQQLEWKKIEWDWTLLRGVLMVGPGFVVDVKYFNKIGAYDGGMKIWGGENIELAWRVSVWLIDTLFSKQQELHSEKLYFNNLIRISK